MFQFEVVQWAGVVSAGLTAAMLVEERPWYLAPLLILGASTLVSSANSSRWHEYLFVFGLCVFLVTLVYEASVNGNSILPSEVFVLCACTWTFRRHLFGLLFLALFTLSIAITLFNVFPDTDVFLAPSLTASCFLAAIYVVEHYKTRSTQEQLETNRDLATQCRNDSIWLKQRLWPWFSAKRRAETFDGAVGVVRWPNLKHLLADGEWGQVSELIRAVELVCKECGCRLVQLTQNSLVIVGQIDGLTGNGLWTSFATSRAAVIVNARGYGFGEGILVVDYSGSSVVVSGAAYNAALDEASEDRIAVMSARPSRAPPAIECLDYGEEPTTAADVIRTRAVVLEIPVLAMVVVFMTDQPVLHFALGFVLISLFVFTVFYSRFTMVRKILLNLVVLTLFMLGYTTNKPVLVAYATLSLHKTPAFFVGCLMSHKDPHTLSLIVALSIIGYAIAHWVDELDTQAQKNREKSRFYVQHTSELVEEYARLVDSTSVVLDTETFSVSDVEVGCHATTEHFLRPAPRGPGLPDNNGGWLVQSQGDSGVPRSPTFYQFAETGLLRVCVDAIAS